MPLNPPISATLGEVNVALSATAAVITPLSAQLDGLISAGIGPYQADLSSQLNASLASQASLSVTIGNPVAALQTAIQAVSQLIAALNAALTLPSIDVSFQTELSAQLALAAGLSVKLGAIQAAMDLALQIKSAALSQAASVAGSLGAGPVFAFSFGGDNLSTTGSEISGLFSGGLTDPPNAIAPTDVVYGVVLVTKSPSVAAALSAIFST